MSSSNPPTIEDRKAEEAIKLPAPPKLKKCHGPCQMRVPYDRAGEHFDLEATAKDGFKRVCKECRAQRRIAKESLKVTERLGHIERNMLKRVAEARSGGPNVPHSADLLERIYILAGGANGIAALLWKTFMMAAPGSPTQQKILAQIISLTHSNTAVGGAKKPAEMYSDDELEAEIDRLTRMRTSIPSDITHTIKILPDEFDEDEPDQSEATA